MLEVSGTAAGPDVNAVLDEEDLSVDPPSATIVDGGAPQHAGGCLRREEHEVKRRRRARTVMYVAVRR